LSFDNNGSAFGFRVDNNDRVLFDGFFEFEAFSDFAGFVDFDETFCDFAAFVDFRGFSDFADLVDCGAFFDV
jgi:hypothetical protein